MKEADQRVFKVGGRDLFSTTVSPIDKRTELLVKMNEGNWQRVAEFDNNESARLFFDLLREHLNLPNSLGGKKGPRKNLLDGMFGGDIFSDFFGRRGESPEVKAARDKAEIARQEANEAKEHARKARAEDLGNDDTETDDSGSNAGCFLAMAAGFFLPPLFLYLLISAVRYGWGG